MRRAVLAAILLCGIPPHLYAQRYSDSEVPRYEVGGQLSLSHFERVSSALGFGANFHYNFNEHFALDSQFTFGPASAAGNWSGGRSTFLTGVRAGRRVEDYGFFLHARGGIVHYIADNGAGPLFSRGTFPAFDVGGTLENYFGSFPDPRKKNMFVRLEVGALIVPYGRATVTTPPPIGSPPPPTGPLGTRVGPVFGLGIGFRF
ncbi:MAG TPA: outer membrane beta-barrel protein [Methylomirabilota bacterium]|nr:outer membrane beta-barrel protein [Methylomirabilota bacterium]